MAKTQEETTKEVKENKMGEDAKVAKETTQAKADKEIKQEGKSQANETKAQKVSEKPVKKEAPKENWGLIHIYSSYNNTHLHVTDISGSETIAKITGGMVSKSDRLKATPNVAMAVAKEIAEGCHKAGINALYVKLRGVGGHNGPMTPGPGAQAAIRMLTRYGIKLGRIEDVTPVPHDTCRKKGGRRGRRV